MITTFLTSIASYIVLDVIASLAVFYYFKRNPRMLSTLIQRALSFVDVYKDMGAMYNRISRLEGRMDREVRNRQILKVRVAKNAPKEITYEELQKLGN